MVTAKDQKVAELEAAYNGLNHVPKIKAAVFRRYHQLSHSGMDYCDALESALIEHAFYKDTRDLPMRDGADEYDLIAEGDKIWADIQKNSGR